MDYDIYSNRHLKSALQKFVRRGMRREAAGVAIALAERGMPLFKRLPMIAAEDVGWEFVAPVFEACRNIFDGTEFFGCAQKTDSHAISALVHSLAGTPKDRESLFSG